MQLILGNTSEFVVPVTIAAKYDNSASFFLKFQNGESSLGFRDNNGNKWGDDMEFARGETMSILLIYNGNYYAQVLYRNT
jgi:hypothetical protein